MQMALQEGLMERDKLANRRGAMHILNICVCKYFVKVSHEFKSPPFPQTLSKHWNEKQSSYRRLNAEGTRQST